MCLHVLYVIDHDSVFEIVKTSQLHHKCNILFFISAAQFYIAANSKHLKHIFWILDVYCGSAMLTAKLETSFTPYWGQNASPQCSPLFCCLRRMQIIQWDFWPHSYNDPKHIMLVLNQLSFYPEVLTVTDFKIVSCVLTIARMVGRHEAGPSVSPGAKKNVPTSHQFVNSLSVSILSLWTKLKKCANNNNQKDALCVESNSSEYLDSCSCETSEWAQGYIVLPLKDSLSISGQVICVMCVECYSP